MAAPAAPSPTPVATLVLHYHVEATPPGARWPRALALIGVLPLLVAPFVDFTFDVSPAAVVAEVADEILRGSSSDFGLALLAGPFFLGVPIFLWQARLLVSAHAGPAERVIVYALASGSSLMTVAFWTLGVVEMLLDGLSLDPETYVVAIFAAVAAVAGATPWWAKAFVPVPEARATIALNLAYLANAGPCLYWFADNRDPGWWITLAGSGALVAELIVITAAARRGTRSAGTPPGSAPASSQ